MPRYIIRRVNPGTEPSEMLKRLRADPVVKVVDEDIPTMLLVEGPGPALETLIANAQGWTVSPEQTYAPPKSYRVGSPKVPPAPPGKDRHRKP
jgi:hypothetical protein